MNAPSVSSQPGDGVILIKPAPYQPPRRRRGASVNWGAPLRWIAVSSVLLAAVGVLWYLFAAYPVSVTAVPEEAAIDISGGFAPHIGSRWLLRAGEYRIAVQAEGYHPHEQALPVGREHPRDHRIELEPLPGHLRVETRPVAIADVYLDDEPAGSSPITLRDIEVGPHKLRLEAERYLPHEQTVEIEGRDREQQLDVELAPAWAEIEIASKPAGAEVRVGDETVGKTPLTAEILQGEQRLSVQLPGYKRWRRRIEVVAGEPQTLPEIVLEKADAVIALSTEPSGVNVLLDGEFQGTSPLELAVSPGEAHTLSVNKQGYGAAQRTVTLKSGETRKLELKLDADLAKVQFAAEPEDAELIIDGKSRGQANQLLFLPTRPHEIEIRKPGYATYKTTLTPRKGTPQQVSVRLPSAQEVKEATRKPRVALPGGPELKLFRNGRVTMGASRREPGRRANEMIRDAELTRPFYIALREVTNGEFRRFRRQHSSKHFQGHSLDGDGQPVVNVTWNDAALYCNWLSAQHGLQPFYVVQGDRVRGFLPTSTGFRLPTEAEWAFVARTVPAGGQLKFPWGDQFPPAQKVGNFADQSAADIVARVIPKYDDGFAVSTNVGRFPHNQHGLFDLGGNVAEWVHDLYDVSGGVPGKVLKDPLGPKAGDYHVIRGSSWAHGTVTELRLSYRDYGNKARDDVGFRIARYAD